jgi:glycosyltransferase involved in cell wall biosynthesis
VAPTEEARDPLERLRRSPLPRVLFVSHAYGGGVARHIGELASVLEGDAELLLLQPFVKSFVALRGLRAGDGLALWLHAATEWERLIELLQAIGIDRIHFHHIHGLPREILELPARLGCPYDVTLHDHFPACPQYHLVDGRGRYCGADPQCRRCLDARPAQWDLTIDQWRTAFRALLVGAQRVIAPSEDCAGRLRGFFPEVSPVVWPHPEVVADVPSVPLRVLVAGAISPAKGLDLLEACVRDAAQRRLPLHFRVLGFVARALPLWPQAPFTLTGEYPDGTLPELLALERGDVVFFPAQCPETFSYTLSDALNASLPIVATDLGALPERLAQRGNARIVRWDAPAAEINDVLLASASPWPASPAAAPRRMSHETYRSLYLEAFRPARERPQVLPPSASPLPLINARWLRQPDEAWPEPSTVELFDDGVYCGRAESLEKLRRRAALADTQVPAAMAELHQARVDLAERDARIAAGRAELERMASRAAAAEHRVGDIERSRSWRLTAPIRALLRLLGKGS